MRKIKFTFIILILITLTFLFFVKVNQTKVKAESYFDESNPSLIQPDKANASLVSTVKTAYELYGAYKAIKNGSDPMSPDRQNWVGTLVAKDMTADPILNTLCGGKMVDDIAIDGDKCFNLPKSTFIVSDIDKELADMGILPGGAVGLTYYTLAYIETEQPRVTNLALFIQDSTKDTIFGTPVYAAGAVNNTLFEMVVLNIWKLSRNVAVMILGIIVAAAGIMIIFRKKISAQAVITIYNVLPRIPIIFGLIILSYPIGAFMLSLAWPLTWFAIRTGVSVVWDAIVQDGGLPHAIISYAVVTLMNVILGMMGAGFLGFITIFLSIVLALAVLFVLIMILFNILKAYVSIMINVMLAPFVIVMGVIPGKEAAIIDLGKKLIIDVISVPVMFLIAFVGAAVVIGTPHWDFDFGIVKFIMFSYFVFLVKVIMGIIIMWQATKVRGKLEKAFGIGAQKR